MFSKIVSYFPLQIVENLHKDYFTLSIHILRVLQYMIYEITIS